MTPKSDETAQNPARRLPAVHAVLALPEASALVEQHGHGRTVDAIRDVLEEARVALRDGGELDFRIDDGSAVVARAARALAAGDRPNLVRVVNATGIILHTGLGRAVMPDAVAEALSSLTGCCNIQTDLETGGRIKRESAIRGLVSELTGAEETLVVNNNAGATMLVLRALAEGKEVIVSRGELIEIGGSFRLPDIMRESGATLREVGATNKTHLRDYEGAIGPQTALLLKAHKSNYEIVGFSKEVGIAEIAEVGRTHGIPVVDDLGCGALVDLARYGLAHEMTMTESLEAGADIVLSSTDKLIGGPQGGLIIGRKDLLDRVRSHPLYRALRVCKMTLAALEATLRLFRSPERLASTHRSYATIAKTPLDMERQAMELAEAIRDKRTDWCVSVEQDISYLGGGSLPGMEMPSFAVRITSQNQSDQEISMQFRTSDPPVIPRVKDGAVWLDMRTVFPEEIPDVLRAVSEEPGIR